MADPILLTVDDLDRAGIDPDDGVEPLVTDGNVFVNTGKEFLLVQNGSAVPVNVSVTVEATVDGQAPTTNLVVAVPATSTMLIGPFPPGIYNDATTGRVLVVCDPITTVKITAVKCTPV